MCSFVEKICTPYTLNGPCTKQFDYTWYYDANLKRCLYSTGYGNCLGNVNKFLSENECMLYCAPDSERCT